MGTLHFLCIIGYTNNTCTKHNSALEKLPHYVSGRLKLTLTFFDTPEFAPVGLSSFPKVTLHKHNTDEKLKKMCFPTLDQRKGVKGQLEQGSDLITCFLLFKTS